MSGRKMLPALIVLNSVLFFAITTGTVLGDVNCPDRYVDDHGQPMYGWNYAQPVSVSIAGLPAGDIANAADNAIHAWEGHNGFINCSYVGFVFSGAQYSFQTVNVPGDDRPAWTLISATNGHATSATTYLNTGSRYTDPTKPNYKNWLVAVFTHEIGHTMSLGEGPNRKAGATCMNGPKYGDKNNRPSHFVSESIVISCDDGTVRTNPYYACPTGWHPPAYEICLTQGNPASPTYGSNDCDSPILVDVDGSGFALCDWPQGVLFDVGGDGVTEQTAWTTSSSTNCFLVLDRNSNGKVDNGLELFGNATQQPVEDGIQPNGYRALAVFDSASYGGNGDGLITNADVIFSALRLWRDLDHNGASSPGELFTLSQKGVTALALDYWDSPHVDSYQNYFRFASVAYINGQVIKTYDVFFISAQWDAVARPVPSTRVVADWFDRRGTIPGRSAIRRTLGR